MLDKYCKCVAYYALNQIQLFSIVLMENEPMSTYVKLATEAGDQYLSVLAEAQENFLNSPDSLGQAGTLAAPGSVGMIRLFGRVCGWIASLVKRSS